MIREESDRQHLIKVVGISASGKSTLVDALRERGYTARPVSQEHSNIPELWRQFDKPDVLIYLDASLACQRARRPDVTWTHDYHLQEVARLSNARDHADLRIDTSNSSPDDVLSIALAYLKHQGISSATSSLPPISRTGAPRKD